MFNYSGDTAIDVRPNVHIDGSGVLEFVLVTLTSANK